MDFLYRLELPVFHFKLVFSLLLSFLITFFSIPIIIKISTKKNLMDEPGIRSSHERKIPNLGGVAIFYSIGVCTPIFAYELFESYKFLFASLIILLYVGVVDDIVEIKPYKKLLLQIIVSALLVIGSDVRIYNLLGVLGIYEMNYLPSVLFSMLTFVILTNAFNLIDGIDGLAGTYALMASASFGINYYRLGAYNYPLVILSAVIIGALGAFLYFNMSDKKIKIFMGDTGSMILGFLLTFSAICFMNLFSGVLSEEAPRYRLQSAPVITVAILIFPIIDTLKVIFIRLVNGKSPFRADRNHIHHKLVELGFSHKKSVICIMVYYIFINIAAYFLRHLEPNRLLLVILILGFIGAYIPNVYLNLKLKKSIK